MRLRPFVVAASALILAAGGARVGLAQPAPAPPQAAPSDDPAAHFERGVNFFRNGDYVAAMVEFEHAYKLDPKPQVLYNIGQTSRELRDYARALKSFERYLAESPDVDAKRRAQVEEYVTELRGKVARLEIVVDVAGAEVTVDDVLVGRTPLPEPLVVNAGRRKIDIKRTGYAPITRYVEIAGTSNDKLTLTLDSLAAPSPTPAPAPKIEVVEPPPPKAEESPGVGRWVGLGITGALGIATGVFGGLALAKGSDFDDALNKVPTNSATIDDARDDARTFAITADVLGGATIAAGITTIIFFAVEGSAGESPKTPEKAQIRPLIGPGFVGASATF